MMKFNSRAQLETKMCFFFLYKAIKGGVSKNTLLNRDEIDICFFYITLWSLFIKSNLPTQKIFQRAKSI